MVQDVDGYDHVLHRKEIVTQGDTLAVISYIIGILPLICELCAAHSQVTQPWYADNAGVGDNFMDIQEHMQDMLIHGTPQR